MKNLSVIAFGLLVLLLLLMSWQVQAQQTAFDLVINHGRVIDPETGTDRVTNIGIAGGRIETISSDPLEGKLHVDASGLVVSPGFIDLHVHSHTEESYRLMVRDGVTTAFALEVGTADVASWYAERNDGQLINYGVAIGHIPVRMKVFDDVLSDLPTGPAAWSAASSAQVDQITDILNEGFDQGAVALGMGLEYTPAADDSEVIRVMQMAAGRNASVHVHLNAGLEGLERALKLAKQTQASLHVVHVNSSAKSLLHDYLDRIDRARVLGQDVTTEAYPYRAGMTLIESAKFDDWERWPEEEFSKFQLAGTQAPLTRETFGAQRKKGGIVVHFTRSEEQTREAIAHPLTMIASDGFIRNGVGHPRASGTYSRVLGRYVREQGVITLNEAIRKMTLEPARRLSARVPAMTAKGRVQTGADADLTIFDPETIKDRSTYENPATFSTGIEYVIVNGQIVIDDGYLDEKTRAGRAVRAPVRVDNS